MLVGSSGPLIQEGTKLLHACNCLVRFCPCTMQTYTNVRPESNKSASGPVYDKLAQAQRLDAGRGICQGWATCCRV